MQNTLIVGYYHCDNCERTADRVRRTRRFWLCDKCWDAIMPDWQQEERTSSGPAWWADNQDQRARVEAYWRWYNAIDKRKPSKYRPPRRRIDLYRSYLEHSPVTSDEYWPICECGADRVAVVSPDRSPGLFGGPFRLSCPVCNGRRTVESLARLADAIHPEWGDEDWLEYLWQHEHELFDVGVLPEYWFELRRLSSAG